MVALLRVVTWPARWAFGWLCWLLAMAWLLAAERHYKQARR